MLFYPAYVKCFDWTSHKIGNKTVSCNISATHPASRFQLKKKKKKVSEAAFPVADMNGLSPITGIRIMTSGSSTS